MNPSVAFAAGSVLGTDHRRTGRNNQDAWRIAKAEGAFAAVVCDGCGSHSDSEIGAKLGARMLSQRFLRQAISDPQHFVEHLLDPLLDTVLALQQIVGSIGVPSKELLYEGFLFTFVAVVASAEVAACFAIGDGVAFVNGVRLPFATFVDNAPPYLGYAVMGDGAKTLARDLVVLQTLPTNELDSFLIGTDGVADLIEAEAQTLPGKTELVGPIQRWWQEDRFFRNSDQVRRTLSLVNQEALSFDWDARSFQKISGRLKDDTTLIAGRKMEADHA